MAKINLDNKASNRISNLLSQLPISCSWIADELIRTLNENEIKEDDKNEGKAND